MEKGGICNLAHWVLEATNRFLRRTGPRVNKIIRERRGTVREGDLGALIDASLGLGLSPRLSLASSPYKILLIFCSSFSIY